MPSAMRTVPIVHRRASAPPRLFASSSPMVPAKKAMWQSTQTPTATNSSPSTSN
nr:hypothetical protein [Rubrobacter tropicus]